MVLRQASKFPELQSNKSKLCFMFFLYSKRIKRNNQQRKHTQMQTPNIQTSLAAVKRRKFILSGAIHLIGSIPLLE